MLHAGSVGGLLWNVGSMTLKAMVETLEGVDEAIHPHYTEKDGKFYLGVEAVNGMALEDVSSLKKALSTERENVRKAKSAIEKFGDLDPDAARDAMKKNEEYANAEPDEKAALEAKSKADQLAKKHKKDLDDKDGVIAGLNKDLDGKTIGAELTAALAKHAPESVKLLTPHVLSVAERRQSDNGMTVKVIGPDGAPMLTTGKGEADMTIDEYVDGPLRALYPGAFPGSGATGSGATGSAAAGKSSGIDPKLSAQERLRQYHEKNG